MLADKTLLQMKYAGIIEEFAFKANIPLEEAMDLFYKSETYKEISNGVADMHCRSEKYLADELKLEFGK
jgi:hypothetical protein